MTATVYRFFDEAGILLYVGISESPLGHAQTQRWWHLVRIDEPEPRHTHRARSLPRPGSPGAPGPCPPF